MAVENGEPSGFHIHESKDKEETTSEKKKSLWSFLRRHESEIDSHVESVEPDPQQNIETDDDDEEDEKSFGSKWFKTWRKKFKGFVDVNPVDESEEEPPKEEETPRGLLSFSGVEEPLPVFDESVLPSYEEPQEFQSEVYDQPIIEERPVFAEEIEEPEDSQEPDIPTPDHSPDDSETEIPEPEELPVESEPELELEEPDLDRSGHAETIPLPGVGASSIPEAPRIEQTIINKSNPAVPLIGLGIAAYEHHRITKTQEKMDNQRDKQQQELQEVKKAQDLKQLELDRKLAELKNTLPIVEKVHEEPKKTPEVKQPQPEQTDDNWIEKAPKQPENIPSVGQIIAERNPQFVEAKETIQKPIDLPEIEPSNNTNLNAQEILKTHFDEKSPELVLQQVEAAAEQDVAQEKQYELRHEVKDVASSLAAEVGGAYSVSRGTSQNTPGYTSSLGGGQPGLYDKATKTTKNAALDQSSSIYKQAVWAGLWGGIVTVIAVVIWMLSI